MSFIHYELDPPISAKIKKEFLFDMDPKYRGQWLDCKIFGVSSYKGHVPTFRVVLDAGTQDSAAAGTLFDYVPPHALGVGGTVEPDTELDLKDLVYHNCMDTEFAIHSFQFLKKKRETELPVQCFFKGQSKWIPGKYVFSMEWHRGNDLLNMMVLENHQICFLPNHKVKFRNGGLSFEPFVKIHSEWAV